MISRSRVETLRNQKHWNWLTIGLLAVLALLAVLPLFVGEGWVNLASEILIMAIAACGLNLILGYAGMVNFGAAGLYGAGAYTTALLLVKTRIPFGFALAAGPVMAAIVGAIIGWFCVRLTQIYFALLTLAFSQIIHTVIHEWYGFTRGDNGILSIRVPDSLAAITHYYYFTLVFFILCIVLMWIIVTSPFGKAMQALRDNQERAEFIGINARRYRLGAFVLSSFFLGFAGSLFCNLNHNVFPNYANWIKGADIIIACLLGGMYNFAGPIVGSAVYVILRKVIMNYTQYWLLPLGLIIVLLVLFFGGGLAGFVSEKLSLNKATNVT